MRASVYACTYRSALHRVNEDRAVVGTAVLDSTATVEHEMLRAPTVVAVLDGLGGHPAGDVASDRAARLIAEADPPGDETAAAELLDRADRAVHAAARENPELQGMGTTVALLALGDTGVVANVGDSSVFALGGDGVVELSTSDRSVGGAILQCLGAFETDPIVPHVRRIDVATGDRFLLASDGLTDVVPRGGVAEALRGDPGDAVARLAALVDEAGTPDDLTVVVVELLDD